MAKESKDVDVQPKWQTPKLEELGNLRDFVRTGQATGKSGVMVDGDSMAGNETMG